MDPFAELLARIEGASLVCRQIKPLLKELTFTRHQYEFTASAFKARFSW
jgi:hypothetical protein